VLNTLATYIWLVHKFYVISFKFPAITCKAEVSEYIFERYYLHFFLLIADYFVLPPFFLLVADELIFELADDK
jgi:hypothetical protein